MIYNKIFLRVLDIGAENVENIGFYLNIFIIINSL